MNNSSLTIDQRFISAINRTFTVIASDLMAAGDADSISGAEAREVTMDSGYMEMYGDDKEAVAEFRKLSYTAQEKIAKRALPCRRYS